MKKKKLINFYLVSLNNIQPLKILFKNIHFAQHSEKKNHTAVKGLSIELDIFSY